MQVPVMADILNAAPVSELEFAGALQALSPQTPIAVAVSGGADSMALLHLTCRWLDANSQRDSLLALTVDHGLRDASAGEARQVAGWCQALGVSHQILHWRGNKPHSDIQAAARQARYALLTEACRQKGINSLLLGHQFEDQAETFLMRLGRGSGVDGLAAMASVREWNGVRLLRPLLGISRQRLRTTLEAFGQPWIEDPSNNDQRFARVRARDVLEDLAKAGISPSRMVATARRMQRVRAALEHATAQLMREAVHWEQAGFAVLRPTPLFAAPEEIGLRMLARVLMAVGGQEYPPRLVRLERLYGWLRQSPKAGGRTLLGCRILLKGDSILIAREMAAIGPEIALIPGEYAVWDNRFQVCLASAGKFSDLSSCTVREVGSEGLMQLRDVLPKNLPPKIICQAMPGFWQGRHLLAAPCLEFTDPACKANEVTFQARFAPGNMLLPDNMTRE